MNYFDIGICVGALIFIVLQLPILFALCKAGCSYAKNEKIESSDIFGFDFDVYWYLSTLCGMLVFGFSLLIWPLIAVGGIIFGVVLHYIRMQNKINDSKESSD